MSLAPKLCRPYERFHAKGRWKSAKRLMMPPKAPFEKKTTSAGASGVAASARVKRKS